MDKKLVITEKINVILERKKWTVYKLSKLADVDDSALYQMVKGDVPFSKDYKEKVLPIIKVSEEEFESWILADEHPKEVIERAIQVKKDFPYKKKSILTTNIDAILKEKSMSRTDLSKVIVYSQSGLNRMIIGEIGMSDSVRERVAAAFEISQDEVLSWIVADRHGLGLLERAFTVE